MVITCPVSWYCKSAYVSHQWWIYLCVILLTDSPPFFLLTCQGPSQSHNMDWSRLCGHTREFCCHRVRRELRNTNVCATLRGKPRTLGKIHPRESQWSKTHYLFCGKHCRQGAVSVTLTTLLVWLECRDYLELVVTVSQYLGVTGMPRCDWRKLCFKHIPTH